MFFSHFLVNSFMNLFKPIDGITIKRRKKIKAVNDEIGPIIKKPKKKLKLAPRARPRTKKK